MKYKALIVDLDGTLFVRNVAKGLPTHRVRKAIDAARKSVHVSIATGRPPGYVEHVLDHLKLSGPSILLDGSLIIDSQTQKVISFVQLNTEYLPQLFSLLQKMKVPFFINELHRYDIFYSSDFIPRNTISLFPYALTDQQVEKIKEYIIHLPDLTTHQVHDWHQKGRWGLEITSEEGSKEHALYRVARILNISPSEIIAVGDGHNDISLLKAAGLKVAMGNAVDELKAVADYIAPSVEEDGLADVIEKFIVSPA